MGKVLTHAAFLLQYLFDGGRDVGHAAFISKIVKNSRRQLKGRLQDRAVGGKRFRGEVGNAVSGFGEGRIEHELIDVEHLPAGGARQEGRYLVPRRGVFGRGQGRRHYLDRALGGNDELSMRLFDGQIGRWVSEIVGIVPDDCRRWFHDQSVMPPHLLRARPGRQMQQMMRNRHRLYVFEGRTVGDVVDHCMIPPTEPLRVGRAWVK